MRLAWVMVALLGACNQEGLPIAATRDAGVDLAAPLADLALAVDLASDCALTPGSKVSEGGQALPYVALGNIDYGNESACGPPPEAVTLLFSSAPGLASPRRYVTAKLPIDASGKLAVEVGTSTGVVSGTLEVTGFTLLGAGPGLATLSGVLDVPGLSLSGAFAADHCAQLDVTCV